MPKICGIYKIESPGGSVYIGQSIEIFTRWAFHKKMHSSSKQYKLYNSLKKYGVSNHSFSIIHLLPNDVDIKTLVTYEQFCMDQFREAGYSLLNLREAGSNGKVSEDTKRRISEANKGHVAHNLGKKHSDETRKKMSISRRKWKITKETGIKISQALKGVAKSEEHKSKIKLFKKGHVRSLETRLKQSATMTGRPQGPHSEATKKKLSEARKLWCKKRRGNAIF